MAGPLDDVCLARVPAAQLMLLAAVRTAQGVRVRREGDYVWLRWSQGDTSVLQCVLPIIGAEFFTLRGECWYRPGRSLPSFGIPDLGTGESLAKFLSPAPMAPIDRGFATPKPVRFALVHDDRPRPTTALRCGVDQLARWADTATTRQLAAIRAAMDTDDVVMLGSKLPMLVGGKRFWGASLFVPLGFRPQPDLPESALHEVLELDEDEIALIDADVVDVIERAAFAPLTRTSARLAARR
jgi:hypothetical protein